MNDFAKRIEKNLSKKRKHTGTQSFEDICFGLVKQTNMSLSDVVSAPTPLVLSMAQQLQKVLKAEQKALKKK